MTDKTRSGVPDQFDPAQASGAADPVPDLPAHEHTKLFPAVRGKAYADLKASIRQHRQKDPVIVHEGQILDGRAVYRACRELGVSPRIQPWDGKGSVVDYIKAKNFDRRHLTPSQRGMIAARILELERRENSAGADESTAAVARANLPAGRRRDRAAKEAGVAPRTVESSGRILKKGVPELAQSVEEGDVPASAAALIAGLPPAEQQDVLAGGPKAIRERAKQLRRSPRKKSTSPKGDPPSAPAPAPVAVSIGPETCPDQLAKELVRALGHDRACQLRDALTRELSA
jgi:ParB-like chromosome segregation protein Spo0J